MLGCWQFVCIHFYDTKYYEIDTDLTLQGQTPNLRNCFSLIFPTENLFFVSCFDYAVTLIKIGERIVTKKKELGKSYKVQTK